MGEERRENQRRAAGEAGPRWKVQGGLKAGHGGVTLGSASTCYAGPDLIKEIVWESSASLTTVMSPVFGKQLIYYQVFQEGQNTPTKEKHHPELGLTLQHPNLL